MIVYIFKWGFPANLFKDIALKVWGKAPLLDLAENWQGDRSLCPKQCLNDPQADSSTPWPPYGSPKVTLGKSTPLLDLTENWQGDRSLCPEQCLNDPQATSSTPWPPYGSPKVTQEKRTPLLDFAENWHGDRSLCPEQCLNNPQVASSTAWPLYWSPKVTLGKSVPLCSIWLKIGMVIDLYVLNNVYMTFKPLAWLLDPYTGH
jgi:hypothetical protein